MAIPSIVIALSVTCVECGRGHETVTGPSDLSATATAALLMPADAVQPPELSAEIGRAHV